MPSDSRRSEPESDRPLVENEFEFDDGDAESCGPAALNRAADWMHLPCPDVATLGGADGSAAQCCGGERVSCSVQPSSLPLGARCAWDRGAAVGLGLARFNLAGPWPVGSMGCRQAAAASGRVLLGGPLALFLVALCSPLAPSACVLNAGSLPACGAGRPRPSRQRPAPISVRGPGDLVRAPRTQVSPSRLCEARAICT